MWGRHTAVHGSVCTSAFSPAGVSFPMRSFPAQQPVLSQNAKDNHSTGQCEAPGASGTLRELDC